MHEQHERGDRSCTTTYLRASRVLAFHIDALLEILLGIGDSGRINALERENTPLIAHLQLGTTGYMFWNVKATASHTLCRAHI